MLETLVISKMWGYPIPNDAIKVTIEGPYSQSNEDVRAYIRKNAGFFAWLIRNTPNFAVKIPNQMSMELYFNPNEYLKFKMVWENTTDLPKR